MKAYEAGNPAYFATPPVQLIYAFNASLQSITKGKVSVEGRFKVHKEASDKFKKAMSDLGLKQVRLAFVNLKGLRTDRDLAGFGSFIQSIAGTRSLLRCERDDGGSHNFRIAVEGGFHLIRFHFIVIIIMQLYYPDGLAASDILPKVAKEGIVITGGLHKDVKGSFLSSINRPNIY